MSGNQGESCQIIRLFCFLLQSWAEIREIGRNLQRYLANNKKTGITILIKVIDNTCLITVTNPYSHLTNNLPKLFYIEILLNLQ